MFDGSFFWVGKGLDNSVVGGPAVTPIINNKQRFVPYFSSVLTTDTDIDSINKPKFLPPSRVRPLPHTRSPLGNLCE